MKLSKCNSVNKLKKGMKIITNAETNRPYDSAWGMYYDEFDNAKPDEIKTWVDNHTEQDGIHNYDKRRSKGNYQENKRLYG